MAHWSLITYTRPNTGVAWFTPGDEVMAVIDTYKNDDVARPTIELYEKSESADGLKQYYKIKFRDTEASETMRDNSVYIANATERTNYCNANGITCLVEQHGDTEPTL